MVRGLMSKARRALRQTVGKITHDPLGPSELHEYWRSPPGQRNRPRDYAAADPARSDYLVELFERMEISSHASVLEIGCNAGRNLARLHSNGWTNLQGIELSPAAVEVFADTFPECYDDSMVTVGLLENELPQLRNDSFDVVFSMAVLEHIHYENEQVLDDVVRIARGWVVTIEDERGYSERHFPRNYRREFEGRDLRQIFENEDPIPGLPWSFRARVFVPEPLA